MVRSFAAGVGRDGVRVNAIAPSFVSTEPQKVWLDDAEASATIASLHILPIPTPEQIAPFVVYLASDESAAVTGTVFPVDAGYMAFKAQCRRDGHDAGRVLVSDDGRDRARARHEGRSPAASSPSTTST